MDEKLILGILAAAASSWLLILVTRKVLDAIDKGMGGKFYTKGWVKKVGGVLDTLLPYLPCLPAGGIAVAIMHYWPPDEVWNNWLLHFLLGALAGGEASRIYYTVTRFLTKRAEQLGGGDSSDPPAP